MFPLQVCVQVKAVSQTPIASLPTPSDTEKLSPFNIPKADEHSDEFGAGATPASKILGLILWGWGQGKAFF